MLGPVVEIKAIDLVNKGRGGSVLREYQRVILDLDVVAGGWPASWRQSFESQVIFEIAFIFWETVP